MKIIRLTEDKLYDIIKNSVTRILKENEQSEINDIYNSKNVIGMENNNPLLDKNWGNGFSLRQFVNIRNISDRIDYCYETLEPIGQGKRRACFFLNNKYVLKITKGDHRYQTKNEYDTSLLMNGIDIFPRIIYQSPDFTWSIVEYARPMTEEDCQTLLGLPISSLRPNEPSLQGFQLWAETKARQPKRQIDNYPSSYYAVEKHNCDAIYSKLAKEHPWFKQLYKLENSQRGDLDFGTDLNNGAYGLREDAFGVVNRNGKDMIVISDIGFIKPFDTRKIKRKYGIDSPQVPEIDF